jgi:hypothetical protein
MDARMVTKRPQGAAEQPFTFQRGVLLGQIAAKPGTTAGGDDQGGTSGHAEASHITIYGRHPRDPPLFRQCRTISVLAQGVAKM